MTKREQVKELISSIFSVSSESISEYATQDQIPGWDSIGHLNLMLAVEETFGIRVGVEQMPELVSLTAIVSYLDASTVGEV